MKIPQSFKKYFWDIDFNSLDIKKYQDYIIERLLEYGDEKAYQWLFNKFSLTKILKVANKSRKISPKTKNFVNIILK
ncbi:MAG: hypothetical protein KatS3mg095_0723 [Candidatus Parcubacteria bacterium]|nr:MAG: hypothetical protein KatS3mg095_0723 [Candidatus Parcubacteria bacterium]